VPPARTRHAATMLIAVKFEFSFQFIKIFPPGGGRD
jgi:hypothetical protein